MAAPNFMAPGALPCSKVELSVSCRNLMDTDVFSKSDPLAVLSIQEFGGKGYREVGRTEMVKNTINPDFTKKFILDYFFEERQMIKFDIYDADSASNNLANHDYLGSMVCTLGEVVTSGILKRPLTGKGVQRGSIVVSSEELSSSREDIHLKFAAKGLDKKDFFGKSDPFLEFRRCTERGDFVLAHRTEVIKSNLNPVWRPFVIQSRTLCNGDEQRTIQISCYDYDNDGSHDLIGSFQTNLAQLKLGPGPDNVYACINPKKKAKKGSKYKDSGTVILQECRAEIVPTFLDYVKGGTQINCTVAVDFTASNGDPRQPSSLHYIDYYRPNEYQRALLSVMEILQDYDSDKLFPALGFGARFPDGRISHEFFLNGHPSNPFCQGIQGIMDAYQRSIQTVQLYGPTNFSPIINHVARRAAEHQDGSNYFILVILTDGVISDMGMTTQAIVKAADLPLSIIIIGVGKADFTAMDTLDGDGVRISYQGRYASRDIVQFVPLRELCNEHTDLSMNKARLAKEVLAEIPEQFVGYMKSRGIKPNPPPPAYIGNVPPVPGSQPPPVPPPGGSRSTQMPPPVPTSMPPGPPGSTAPPPWMSDSNLPTPSAPSNPPYPTK